MALIGVVLSPSPVGADDIAPPTPGEVRATAGDAPAVEGTGVDIDGDATTLAGASYSRNATITSAAARTGTGGLRVASSSAPAYVRWDTDVVEQGHTHATVRMWVRVDSRAAGESVDLLTVANRESSRNFDFFVTGDTQRFKWDIAGQVSGETRFEVELGRWYYVEAQVEYAGTSHTAEVRIDGVDQQGVTSTGVPSQVRSITVGSFRSKTHSQDYDDLAVRLGDATVPWLPAPGGGDEVTVSWAPVTDLDGIREYQVWRDGRWYGWAPGDATTFVDRAPNGGYYQVRAVDGDLNRSGWSARAYVEGGPDVTPPPVPDGVTVVREADGSATLSWQGVVDIGGAGLREYAIYKDGRWYGWVPAPTTTFTDGTAAIGATYQVRAIDRELNRSARSAPAVLAA